VQALVAVAAACADLAAQNTVSGLDVCHLAADCVYNTRNFVSGGAGPLVLHMLTCVRVDVTVADGTRHDLYAYVIIAGLIQLNFLNYDLTPHFRS
jgi:hypothetical protein